MKKYTATIFQRIPKTPNNIYGCVVANDIHPNKKSVVIFGGENTHTGKDANYYMSCMEKIIGNNADIYAISYNTTNNQAAQNERKKIANSTHKNAINPKEIPDAAIELFDKIIRPRITDEHGKKLDYSVMIKNMQNLTIYTHCHGSVIPYHFQKMMIDAMRSIGYKKFQIVMAMQNLCVIQHAPVVPLTKNKFSTLSFMSAQDSFIKTYKILPQWMVKNAENMEPSFFPSGNLVVVYQVSHKAMFEHTIDGYVYPDILTPDGAFLFDAEKTAIINAIKRDKVLSPEKLLSGAKIPFNDLRDNGTIFYKMIQIINRREHRAQIQARANQK